MPAMVQPCPLPPCYGPSSASGEARPLSMTRQVRKAQGATEAERLSWHRWLGLAAEADTRPHAAESPP